MYEAPTQYFPCLFNTDVIGENVLKAMETNEGASYSIDQLAKKLGEDTCFAIYEQQCAAIPETPKEASLQLESDNDQSIYPTAYSVSALGFSQVGATGYLLGERMAHATRMLSVGVSSITKQYVDSGLKILEGAWEGGKDVYHQQQGKVTDDEREGIDLNFSEEAVCVRQTDTPVGALRLAIDRYQQQAKRAEKTYVENSEHNATQKQTLIAGIEAVYEKNYREDAINPSVIITRHRDVVAGVVTGNQLEADKQATPALLPNEEQEPLADVSYVTWKGGVQR